MTAYTLVTTPIWKIDISGMLQRIIVLGCGAGIAWFAYNKHAESIDKIRNDNSNDFNT